ncbi:MAG: LuxR C-terminal-related transcriptional regulator [Caldilineaceae bacterium]
MSMPILATKLYIPPPRPDLVIRPRLSEQLSRGLRQQQGFGRKLTLISAPAGFGKSTLVSAWLKSCTCPVAWLSLDAEESELSRFLTYLIAALQTLPLGEVAAATPKLGVGILNALQSPQPPAPTLLLTTLINEIAAVAEPFILVLDDYHRVDAKPVDEALTFFLDHLPPQMHLVITTREDPQLPLARYRARDQMIELRAADLRFTPAEAADFLHQVMTLDLSPEEVAILETRTEGWIAGLQLAALSLRGRVRGTSDITHFVKAFAGDNRYIVDYLVEEVLQYQPEPVRSFLLQTSILERLSGPLCDAVTGQKDGMALLEILERENLFVVPLDDQRHWFRYHHLFAAVLATHAQQEQPALVPILHQRASAWYAANGLPADAIRHALVARDFVRAAGLVELSWPAMDGSFQAATWLSWARALPDVLVRARPALSVAYAWALLNGGELEAAEARLRDAERWLATLAADPQRLDAPATEMVVVDEEQFRNLPMSIATARAYRSQAAGDLPGSIKYGQQALDLLPADAYLRRGPAAALLGLAQWASGDLEAAFRTLAEAMAGFQQAGNLHFALSVTMGLVEIRTVQGRLREAIQINRQSLQLALAQGEPLLRGTADLYLGLSELYREQGDLESARHHLRRSEELGEQAALPDWRYRHCRAQARLQQSAGDLEGALEQLDLAAGYYRRTPLPDVRPLAALKARLWVAQGRLHEARRWVQEQRLTVDDELSYLHEFEQITLARLLLAEYMHNQTDRTVRDALHLLDRLQQAAEAEGRMGSVIEIGMLQALAYQGQGQLALALGALERSLTLAEPEGYVRIFVDEGVSMVSLLSTAFTEGVMPDYSGKLLAALGAPQPKVTRQSANPTARQPHSLIEPLSEREVEVLKLLGTELSGPEIAHKLMVSLNTMRTHTKNIFSKLGVNNRLAAIHRAEELGLL